MKINETEILVELQNLSIMSLKKNRKVCVHSVHSFFHTLIPNFDPFAFSPHVKVTLAKIKDQIVLPFLSFCQHMYSN